MKQNKKIKTVIIILSVLLAVSVTGLAVTLVYNRFIQNEPISVEVPGNIITPDGEDSSDTDKDNPSDENDTNDPKETDKPDSSNTSLSAIEQTGTASDIGTKASAVSLHNRKSEDNIPFQLTNIFPGDKETKYYCIKVSYKGDIVLRYRADIREGYEKSAEVLKVKIRLPETEETLYDGLMKDMPESLNHALYTNTKTQSEIYYEITAYLDTGVGNEYQDKYLFADFHWWVEETDNLDSPQTSDKANICLWICLASGSLFLLFILIGKRRKEAADE